MSIQINGTSGISGVDGTAGTPALQGTDSNTGISFGADQVNINTGGSTRATVDSSGRVGISNQTPGSLNSIANQLVIGGGSGSQGLSIFTGNAAGNQGSIFFADGTASGAEQAAGYLIYQQADNYMAFGTVNTERVRIDSSGRLLVGTTTAQSQLTVESTSSTAYTTASVGNNLSLINSSTSANVYTGIRLLANGPANTGTASINCTVTGSGDGALTFSTRGSSTEAERMRITSNGSTLINTSSVAASGSILSLGGTVTWGVGPQPGGSTFYVYNPSNVGVYITNGANAWSASSDERLKNITGTITDGLNKVNSLRAVEFSWLSDEHNTPQVGLIAQDVQVVLPEAITEDNGYLGVKYSEVIPLLVSALKEAKGRIEALEAEVAALKAS